MEVGTLVEDPCIPPARGRYLFRWGPRNVSRPTRWSQPDPQPGGRQPEPRRIGHPKARIVSCFVKNTFMVVQSSPSDQTKPSPSPANPCCCGDKEGDHHAWRKMTTWRRRTTKEGDDSTQVLDTPESPTAYSPISDLSKARSLFLRAMLVYFFYRLLPSRVPPRRSNKEKCKKESRNLKLS